MATTKDDRDWLRDFSESERRWWSAGTERGRACKAVLALLDERDALANVNKEAYAANEALRAELADTRERTEAICRQRDSVAGRANGFERDLRAARADL